MSKEKEFSGSTPADFIPLKKVAEKPPTIVQTIIWTFLAVGAMAMVAITMNYEYRASLATTERVLLTRIWATDRELHNIKTALNKRGIKVETNDKHNDHR